jgi:hypothetical protein
MLMQLELPNIQIAPYKKGDFVRYFKSYEVNEAARLRRNAEKAAFEAKVTEMVDAAVAKGEDAKKAEKRVRLELQKDPEFTIKATRKRAPKSVAKKAKGAK